MRLTRRPMLLQLDARKGIPPLDSMNNLLTDPVIRADHADGSRKTLALPEVYEVMMADLVTGFPALRPHQRHAWHAFLAQLGVIALVRAGREEPPRSASKWHDLIRALTPDFPEDEPWCLVVEDVSKPAFMQCPVPNGLANYKKEIVAPDDLDVLVTSKNHDVKSAIGTSGRIDDWILAIISVQTMAGFGGVGNHGIARMNGGASSRPCVGLAPAAGGPGAHLRHDIRTMFAARDELLRAYPEYYRTDDGVALLWTEPWDGTTSLALDQLDPYFIEVCRRVRLCRSPEGRITGRRANTRKTRVAAKQAKGDIGDHWTPVSTKGKALTISPISFRYNRLAELVLNRKSYRHPAAMKAGANGSGRWRLVARGMAGGMGKTAGYHERSDIVIGGPMAHSMLGGHPRRDELEQLSRDQLAEVGAVARALRFAIAVAASGGKDATDISKSDREKAYPYTRRLDDTVDVHFFAALQDRFNAAESERHSAQRRFATALIDRAKSLLREAAATVPCARIQRYRARARAESAFWGSLTKSGVIDLDEVFVDKQLEDQDDA